MADEQTRNLQRAAALGDMDAAAAVLRERVRAGELTKEHVELAARLGHPVARLLCSEVELVEWERENDTLSAASELSDETLPARIAADWTERVLPAWESEHPGDQWPRKAIAATRAWVNCPCESHRSALVAYRRTRPNRDWNDWTALDQAVDAATDAAVVTVYFFDSAVQAASRAAAHAADADAEREWQRLRLAAYVLGEVEPA